VKVRIKEDDICPKCSFPKELCICEDLEAEDQLIRISNERRRWGKIVTIVKFNGDFDLDLDDLSTKAKKKCASGGTYRDKTIEVQGDHRLKLKKFLINEGFTNENIIIED
jgi:translation initiation factor 1